MVKSIDGIAIEKASENLPSFANEAARKGGECSVPVGESNSDGVCALSGEKFEVFWDEEEEEWRYKNCVRLPNGSLVLASLAKSQPPSATTHGKEGCGPDVTKAEAERSRGQVVSAPVSTSVVAGGKAADDSGARATLRAIDDDGAVDLSKLNAAGVPSGAVKAAQKQTGSTPKSALGTANGGTKRGPTAADTFVAKRVKTEQ